MALGAKLRKLSAWFTLEIYRIEMATNILYPLASLSQIKETPSMIDGVPPELEEDLRTYGCKLIQQAGLLLKQCEFSSGCLCYLLKFMVLRRNQVAMATAQVLFQRFWYVTSMKQFGIGVGSRPMSLPTYAATYYSHFDLG